MPKNKAINLLPSEEFNASTTGRILRWATGTFRIIVIITEMVVMGAFLSRFWLDAQNSNLNNAIKIKSAQIAAQATLEKQFRGVQTKLEVFNQLDKDQRTSEFTAKITGKVPTSITLSGIVISEGTINVRGVSFSDYDIAQFVANLGGAPFKSAELTQISSSKDNPGASEFTIVLKY